MRNRLATLAGFVATIVGLANCTLYAQIKESPGKYPSQGEDVRYELFEPVAAGSYPAVVILPGTFGLLPPWGKDIRKFGQELAEQNIVAMIPRYFDSTGTAPGLGTTSAIKRLAADLGDKWNTAIEDGIEFLTARPNVDSSRLGLLGFSLGGNRALTLAMKPRRTIKIQRVVEFFAPTTIVPLGGDVENLPKLQIHHGDDNDEFVPPSETIHLIQLKVSGKSDGADFQVFWYPGAGHVFKGEDLTNSRRETIDFFKEL